MSSSRNIFITGSTGFIGAHLAVAFLRHGHRVIALVRRRKIDPRLRLIDTLQKIMPPDEVQALVGQLDVLEGDITVPRLGLSRNELNELVSRVDVVFHCAASVRFEHVARQEIHRCNVIGTEHVLHFLAQCPRAALHYMSSAYVAGQRGGVALEDQLDGAAKFSNPYEETKYQAEQLVRNFMKTSGASVSIYRPSVVVGDSQTGKTTSFHGFYGLFGVANAFTTQIRSRFLHKDRLLRFAGISQHDGYLDIPMRISLNGQKTLNLVPIDFVVNVVISIFESPQVWGKSFHIVNPSPPTIAELAQTLTEFLKVRGVMFVDPARFTAHNPRLLEWLFMNAIQRYKSYLEGEEPTFDCANTTKVLEGRGLACPSLDRDCLNKLLDYCLSANWGKS